MQPVARLALACTALVLVGGVAALVGAPDAPLQSEGAQAPGSGEARRVPCPAGSLADRGVCLPVPERPPSPPASGAPGAPGPAHSTSL
ncbi:MAG TPA: hypothetical protein VKY73_22100 [Polyangiaceae bacterium]|nr:hypothetical protein [Polyangiaceae bacterium]